jgi:ABC-type nitrate/sulfonate/bicarbonate transport system permease component
VTSRLPGRTGERVAYGVGTLVVTAAAYGLVSNLYQLVDTQGLPRSIRLLLRPGILPPIQTILAVFGDVLWSGQWLANLGASLRRVLEGLSLGVALGVGTGLAMGWSERVDQYLDPIYNLLRPVPPLAFVTLFILWFGIGETSKVLLITYGVFMTTVVPAYQGVRDVPVVYIKAARALGAPPRQLLLRVVLPAAFPRILAGFRLALMAAWGIIVAAELIASTSGLGYMIIMAQAQYDTAVVMVGIGSLAAVGFAMDTAVRLLGARLTHWMRRAEA